jgi:branched-chain amino acid transport system substrate-binding protein
MSLRLALAGALALLLAPGAGIAKADDTYPIHVIAAMTGRSAFIGQSTQRAVKITEQAINQDGGLWGKKVQFVFHDDTSEARVGVQLINELMSDEKPPFVIVASPSATCAAIAPLVTNGPVLYCLTPSIQPTVGSYVFAAQASTVDYTEGLLRFFRGKGWTRIAVISTTDASGQDFDRGLAAVLAKDEFKTLTVAEHVHYNVGDPTVSAQIERMRAANPHALITWATIGTAAVVFRGLVQAGLDLPTAASTGNAIVPQLKQFADFLPRELYFAAGAWMARNDGAIHLDAKVAAEQKDYFALAAANGLAPDVTMDPIWDVPRLLVAQLRKLGPDATAQQLHDRLLSLDDYDGVDGHYDFRAAPQRGLNINDVVIGRWEPAEGTWRAVSELGGDPIR